MSTLRDSIRETFADAATLAHLGKDVEAHKLIVRGARMCLHQDGGGFPYTPVRPFPLVYFTGDKNYPFGVFWQKAEYLYAKQTDLCNFILECLTED
jgi:hypothetical protein